MDWFKESDIDDSGFSEAAADAFLAALVNLNNELGGSVFNSPMHFIGHSRGTVVNSELIQRLGAYFPDIPSIQMTTLDPHDQDQPSLNVPLGTILGALGAVPGLEGAATIAGALVNAAGINTIHYGNFDDPNVTRWSNVTFADNYYQDVASTTSIERPVIRFSVHTKIE